MKSKINKIYPFIFSISIIFIIIFMSFYIACFFDKNMLMKLWQKYNTIKELPFTLTSDDLYKLQDELMLFLRGKLAFLETKVHIDGILTDFYSIRSKIHMGDVRILFNNFTNACFIAIALAIFSLYKSKDFKNPFVDIRKAYHKTLFVFMLIFIALLIFAIHNFDLFFIKFHQSLFTNDYWLLNPEEDFIICLLPEIVFINIGIRIAILIVINLTLFGLLCQILSKIQHSPEAK